MRRLIKLLVPVLILALAFVLTGTFSTVFAETSVNEDFEDSVADGFSAVTGTWSIITDGTKVYSTASEAGRSVVGDTAATDVSVQSQVKVAAWNAQTDRTVGLMARYADVNNYYMFIYEDGYLYIKKKVSGAITNIASKSYTFATGTWYTFKGEVEGTSLRFYVGGTLQLSGTDSSLGTGKVGCITFNGDCRFDNFIATYPEYGSTADKFGINIFHATKSNGKAWDSQSLLSQTFDTDWDDSFTYDPYVQMRGWGQFTCTGNGELKVGRTGDGGESPRFYIGDGVNAWDGNVEVTFYSKVVTVDKNYTDDPPNGSVCWPWGGLEAVVRTTHIPDSDACNSRGYGGRMTLDGDCDIEKEQSHPDGANSQSAKAYPWGQNDIPTNQWIGYKFVVRDQGAGSNVHLELYVDKTSNGNPDYQVWEKIIDYTDYDGKIWDSQDQTFCCTAHAYKSLRGTNATTQKYVYFRTDGVTDQRYKWMSVREIDPES